MNISNSYSDDKEINKNNENLEEVLSECTTDSDFNDNSRKQFKEIFVCTVNNCGKEYQNKLLYQKHFIRCHSNKTLHLKYSEWSFNMVNKEYMDQHQIIHSDGRPFICSSDGCGKTFKRKAHLKEHRKEHKRELFQCTRKGCEQTFNAERYLKRHIKDKHSSVPKSYECRFCSKSFGTKEKSQNHKRKVHRILDRPIVCQIDKCNRQFKSRFFYRQHKQLCHSGQEFRCDHSGCDYVTTKKNLIINHVKIHLDKIVCGIDGCIEAYKGINSLKNHRNRHSLKRFVCKVDGCQQAFGSNCLYKAHLRQCHNGVLLSCKHSDCDYTTKNKGHLKIHLKSHSNEYPFVCNSNGCGKAYKHKQSLKIHRLTHIETLEDNSDKRNNALKERQSKQRRRRLSCPKEECRQTFNKTKTLNVHIKKYHSMIKSLKFSYNSGENSKAKNSKHKIKRLKTDFKYCTKRFLSDLKRRSETDQQSLEPESNQSIPLTITSNNTFESNANNFVKQSKTQIVLSEDSVDDKDGKQYRCVWPGCQFVTDQSDLSETHRLVSKAGTSDAGHRPQRNYECDIRTQFITHFKYHKTD